MDEKIENPELKEIMAIDPEDMSEEELERFVDAFMNATLIIPAEVNTDKDISALSDEEIALDEEIDITILKLEDEDSDYVFIPAYTDDEEVEKLKHELKTEIYGLIFETEDLANLLYESYDEDIEGIVINPFTDFTAEIPLESLFELFDFVECDDPNCTNPNHHHHEHEHDHHHEHEHDHH